MSVQCTRRTCRSAHRISAWGGRADVAQNALYAAFPSPMSALRELHIPKNRRAKLENSSDVLSEGRRLNPFSPGHVGHFAEGDFLDPAGELLAFGFIGRAPPVGDELLQLR